LTHTVHIDRATSTHSSNMDILFLRQPVLRGSSNGPMPCTVMNIRKHITCSCYIETVQCRSCVPHNVKLYTLTSPNHHIVERTARRPRGTRGRCDRVIRRVLIKSDTSPRRHTGLSTKNIDSDAKSRGQMSNAERERLYDYRQVVMTGAPPLHSITITQHDNKKEAKLSLGWPTVLPNSTLSSS